MADEIPQAPSTPSAPAAPAAEAPAAETPTPPAAEAKANETPPPAADAPKAEPTPAESHPAAEKPASPPPPEPEAKAKPEYRKNHQPEYKDHYDALGLPRGASAEDIAYAAKRIMAENHPDRNPSVEAAKLYKAANNARDDLTDESKRRSYDRQLERERTAPPKPESAEKPAPEPQSQPQRPQPQSQQKPSASPETLRTAAYDYLTSARRSAEEAMLHFQNDPSPKNGQIWKKAHLAYQEAFSSAMPVLDPASRGVAEIARNAYIRDGQKVEQAVNAQKARATEPTPEPNEKPRSYTRPRNSRAGFEPMETGPLEAGRMENPAKSPGAKFADGIGGDRGANTPGNVQERAAARAQSTTPVGRAVQAQVNELVADAFAELMGGSTSPRTSASPTQQGVKLPEGYIAEWRGNLVRTETLETTGGNFRPYILIDPAGYPERNRVIAQLEALKIQHSVMQDGSICIRSDSREAFIRTQFPDKVNHPEFQSVLTGKSMTAEQLRAANVRVDTGVGRSDFDPTPRPRERDNSPSRTASDDSEFGVGMRRVVIAPDGTASRTPRVNHSSGDSGPNKGRFAANRTGPRGGFVGDSMDDEGRPPPETPDGMAAMNEETTPAPAEKAAADAEAAKVAAPAAPAKPIAETAVDERQLINAKADLLEKQNRSSLTDDKKEDAKIKVLKLEAKLDAAKTAIDSFSNEQHELLKSYREGKISIKNINDNKVLKIAALETAYAESFEHYKTALKNFEAADTEVDLAHKKVAQIATAYLRDATSNTDPQHAQLRQEALEIVRQHHDNLASVAERANNNPDKAAIRAAAQQDLAEAKALLSQAEQAFSETPAAPAKPPTAQLKVASDKAPVAAAAAATQDPLLAEKEAALRAARADYDKADAAVGKALAESNRLFQERKHLDAWYTKANNAGHILQESQRKLIADYEGGRITLDKIDNTQTRLAAQKKDIEALIAKNTSAQQEIRVKLEQAGAAKSAAEKVLDTAHAEHAKVSDTAPELERTKKSYEELKAKVDALTPEYQEAKRAFLSMTAQQKQQFVEFQLEFIAIKSDAQGLSENGLYATDESFVHKDRFYEYDPESGRCQPAIRSYGEEYNKAFNKLDPTVQKAVTFEGHAYILDDMQQDLKKAQKAYASAYQKHYNEPLKLDHIADKEQALDRAAQVLKTQEEALAARTQAQQQAKADYEGAKAAHKASQEARKNVAPVALGQYETQRIALQELHGSNSEAYKAAKAELDASTDPQVVKAAAAQSNEQAFTQAKRDLIAANQGVKTAEQDFKTAQDAHTKAAAKYVGTNGQQEIETGRAPTTSTVPDVGAARAAKLSGGAGMGMATMGLVNAYKSGETTGIAIAATDVVVNSTQAAAPYVKAASVYSGALNKAGFAVMAVDGAYQIYKEEGVDHKLQRAGAVTVNTAAGLGLATLTSAVVTAAGVTSANALLVAAPLAVAVGGGVATAAITEAAIETTRIYEKEDKRFEAGKIDAQFRTVKTDTIGDETVKVPQMEAHKHLAAVRQQLAIYRPDCKIDGFDVRTDFDKIDFSKEKNRLAYSAALYDAEIAAREEQKKHESRLPRWLRSGESMDKYNAASSDLAMFEAARDEFRVFDIEMRHYAEKKRDAQQHDAALYAQKANLDADLKTLGGALANSGASTNGAEATLPAAQVVQRSNSKFIEATNASHGVGNV